MEVMTGVLWQNAELTVQRRAEIKRCPDLGGGRNRARTCDPLIKSQLLYQLSYAPSRPEGRPGQGPTGVSLSRTPRCDKDQVVMPPLPGYTGTRGKKWNSALARARCSAHSRQLA
jgi:hypothetical protein